MFERKHWMDRHLATLGFAMFVIGMVLLAFGTLAVLIEEVTGQAEWTRFPQDSWSLVRGIFYIATLHYGLGSSLAWIGALFYCLGRFLEVGLVTIVGFGQTDPSEIIVKGPDENRIVWVGRPYGSELDAYQAAQALAKRFGTVPVSERKT